MDQQTQGEGFSPDTAATRLHRELRTRLCEGDFAPGDVISIRRIATEYGTSAMPAREAVRWLVTEGALVFSDSRKIRVPELSRERFHEVLFARQSLETEVSRQAFPRLNAEDLAELEGIDARINAAIEAGDMQAYMRGNHRFHFLIYRRSLSRVLLPLVELLWLQYGPSMRQIGTRWGASSIADDHHRDVTQALSRETGGVLQRYCRGYRTGMRLLE